MSSGVIEGLRQVIAATLVNLHGKEKRLGHAEMEDSGMSLSLLLKLVSPPLNPPDTGFDFRAVLIEAHSSNSLRLC